MPYSDLLFINQFAEAPMISDATRKKIKQHVMRDIGYSRRRPRGQSKTIKGRLSTASYVLDSQDVCGEIPSCSPANNTLVFMDNTSYEQPDTTVALLHSVLPSELPVLPESKPTEMSFSSPRKAVAYRHENINDEFFDVYRVTWYRQNFLNSCTLEGALSMVKACWHVFDPSSTLEANFWSGFVNTDLIRGIRDYLSDPRTRHSDNTIAAITTALSQSLILEDAKAAKIHLEGLKTVLDARGGIDRLDSIIIQFFISSGDTVTAYHDNRSPLFSLPASPYREKFCGISSLPLLAKGISKVWRHKISAHMLYIKHFESLMLCIAYVRQRPDDAFNAGTVATCVVTLLHRFQTSAPLVLSGTSTDLIAECVRLTVPLSLAEVRRRCGVSPSFCGKYLTDLRAALRHEKVDWSGLEGLKLWMCAVGATEATAGEKTWFEEQMLATIAYLPRTVQSEVLRSIGELILTRRVGLRETRRKIQKVLA